ncbi:MAG: pyridoxamine 5'-phosphate oxidase family protein [Pseudomonadota bacterium]
MKQIVADQKLGFVGTVNADGSPNVSPKGTFLVLDDEHIMFGEIRSPQTLANIAERPAVEVNFVDPFVRKGLRVKGPARFVAGGSAEFAELEPKFREVWGALCDVFGGIVVIDVEKVAPLTSPAYDVGASEEELKAQYFTHFTELHKT